MSIAPMIKIEVWAYESESDRILKLLLRQRCVDVDKIPVTEGLSSASDNSEIIRTYEKSLVSIDTALTALYPYSTRKKSLIKKKVRADVEAFADSPEYNLTKKAVDRVCMAVNKRSEFIKNKNALLSESNSVEAWADYDLPLGYKGTDTSSVVLGSIPNSIKSDIIEDRLSDLSVSYRKISDNSGSGCYMFISYKDDTAVMLRRLGQMGFIRSDFSDEPCTARDKLIFIQSQIDQLDKNDKAEMRVLKDSAALLDDIETLYDVESTKLQLAEYRSRLVSTGSCVLLRGWIPENRKEKISAVLSNFECAYEFSTPTEEDKVPVKLENNFFARNFEWIIAMYSLPAYGSYDPTFIMSICFCILFSMMFADVGYGLLLVLGGFLVPKILGFGEGTKRAFNMFGFCGIFCIISGVLFGGYFGDLPLAIAKAINPSGAYPETLALLVDPVLDPMTFLIAGLAVGFLHLVTGQFIKFCQVIKKNWVDAVCDYVFYWIIYIGLILLILKPDIGKYVALTGCALVVLTAGRKEKNIFMKLPKGFLGLYGLVNFGSDIISYSRILAIALSGTVLAQVFNILATMSNSPLFRVLGTPIILIVGHVLNLALSALSAFVHTSRLQYVEFFGKFYEDGGRPFLPMLPSNKFTENY